MLSVNSFEGGQKANISAAITIEGANGMDFFLVITPQANPMQVAVKNMDTHSPESLKTRIKIASSFRSPIPITPGRALTKVMARIRKMRKRALGLRIPSQ